MRKMKSAIACFENGRDHEEEKHEALRGWKRQENGFLLRDLFPNTKYKVFSNTNSPTLTRCPTFQFNSDTDSQG